MLMPSDPKTIAAPLVLAALTAVGGALYSVAGMAGVGIFALSPACAAAPSSRKGV